MASELNDGGLAVVRVKPLGAGGGGVEEGAEQGSALTATEQGTLRIAGRSREYTYPRHVIRPESTQEALYEQFMPARIQAFLSGVDVNIVCYGHTGSGKTHTMFGPPGLMAEASTGAFGTDVCPDYGLCPRGLLDILSQLEALRADAAGARYELSASAVELTVAEGNLDMLSKAEAANPQGWSKPGGMFWAGSSGVCLDKTVKPVSLLGQNELWIEGPESIFELFRAIASRNTTGTGMNDTSSRSHCFVFLTLHAANAAAGWVRTSRFQFVDLAGSERIKAAHGNVTDYHDMGVVEGMCTNFTLVLLSQRVRELAAAAKAGKDQAKLVQQSFKTQGDPDLLVLLGGSLAGSALSLIIVCLSSAKANVAHNVNALDFGQEFSKLSLRPRANPEVPVQDLVREAERMLAAGRGGGGVNPKYAIMRKAQAQGGEQRLATLRRLGLLPR